MDRLVIIFATIGIFFSALAIVLRLSDVKARRNPADILFNVGLFAIMWYVFVYMMIITGYIQQLPNCYNKGIPLYYLIAPCFYFYVQLKLYPAKKMPRYWYLHALPFAFGLVDIMPYALATDAEKNALMQQLVENISIGFQHDYGFIDQQWHYLIRLSLAFVYLLAQWRLLFMVDTTEGDISSKLLFFLNLLTVIYSLFIVIQVSMVLSILFNRLQAAYILKDSSQLIWLSTLYLIFSIWICFGARTHRT
ncbi:hypothetical protein [Parapedobacter koreensis]|uniref:Uncharacterized protein n=1 Tax=Parapedobacter koreensis TaxID=332977 RepID=A0A1H7S888_9SPHI|nr:hypothetical protein [Parapedobacter koreensis]SEL68703.1 hypothetical protein SAMN05421740_108142 [Parapedobacter koreensis]